MLYHSGAANRLSAVLGTAGAGVPPAIHARVASAQASAAARRTAAFRSMAALARVPGWRRARSQTVRSAADTAAQSTGTTSFSGLAFHIWSIWRSVASSATVLRIWARLSDITVAAIASQLPATGCIMAWAWLDAFSIQFDQRPSTASGDRVGTASLPGAGVFMVSLMGASSSWRRLARGAGCYVI